MTDNINIEKPLPIKTYNVSKVNEKLKRLEEAIESGSGASYTAGIGIEITSENVINNTAPGITSEEVASMITDAMTGVNKWTLHNSTDWYTNIAGSTGLLYDCLVVIPGKGVGFFPKGISPGLVGYGMTVVTDGNHGGNNRYITSSNIFTTDNRSTIAFTSKAFNVSEVNGVLTIVSGYSEDGNIRKYDESNTNGAKLYIREE